MMQINIIISRNGQEVIVFFSTYSMKVYIYSIVHRCLLNIYSGLNNALAFEIHQEEVRSGSMSF